MLLNEHTRLYRALNEHRVKYLVIGGVASIIYGVPRATLDIDILIGDSVLNAQRFLDAIKSIKFGAAFLVTPEKMVKNNVTIFEDYFRVDVFSILKGIDFSLAWENRIAKDIEGTKVNFVSVKDLISSKRATGRKKDKEDVKILKGIYKKRGCKKCQRKKK